MRAICYSVLQKMNWAGWKDAPLSDLGRKQAYALGHSFASTPLTHIYASDLQRAYTTAQFVHQHQPEPEAPLTATQLLREQHFGVAEGHPWVDDPPAESTLDELFAQNLFPVLYKRDERFPQDESLNDLAARGDGVIKEFVLPYVLADADAVHIALASHSLCISETVAALVRLDPEAEVIAGSKIPRG